MSSSLQGSLASPGMERNIEDTTEDLSLACPETARNIEDITQNLEVVPSTCESPSSNEYPSSNSDQVSAPDTDDSAVTGACDRPACDASIAKSSASIKHDSASALAISVLRKRLAVFKGQLRDADVKPQKATKAEKKGADAVLARYSLPLLNEDYPPENPGKKRDPYVRDPETHNLAMHGPKWLPVKTDIEDILQYSFKDDLLLREAMYTHSAHTARLANGVMLRNANYTLAQHGDAILRSTLTDCWWEEVEPDNMRMTKGDFQKRLEKFICDDNLIPVAEEWGITAVIKRTYPWGSERAPCKKDSATTFEALIGAVHVDCGGDMDVVRGLLSRLLKVKLDGGSTRSPTANERARKLTAKLDQGDSVGTGILVRLLASIVRQKSKASISAVLRKMAGKMDEVGQYIQKL